MSTQHPDSAEYLLRDLAPQVLAAVARRLGDFAAAEDAVQEALIAAASQWMLEGVPDNPRGWLYQVALRRHADRERSERARRRREEAIAAEQPTTAPTVLGDFGEEEDDSLLLLFMCCHPALTPSSAIALTLRAVGGLSTAEIANAFMVPEATMAQRISRAKLSIRSSRIPVTMPTAEERADRLVAVLHVLYLMFNEGYTSSSGPDLGRTDLSNEAIRLTRMLRAQLPGDAEVAGLVALMLLTDARRGARTGPSGELVPLDEQDRSRWNRKLIDEGSAIISRVFGTAPAGPYQLQAAVAALHGNASRVEETDWPQIMALYGILTSTTDNPMVALNYAIAAAMVYGPQKGIAMLEDIARDPRISSHYRIPAVRAHLLERAGDISGAVDNYRLAADGTMSLPERNYLIMKAARLGVGQP